jgi:hypothetical protein
MKVTVSNMANFFILLLLGVLYVVTGPGSLAMFAAIRALSIRHSRVHKKEQQQSEGAHQFEYSSADYSTPQTANRPRESAIDVAISSITNHRRSICRSFRCVAHNRDVLEAY